MPIERSKLNRSKILTGEAVVHGRTDSIPVHHDHSDDYVKGVKSGHAEVETKEVLVLIEVRVPHDREHPVVSLVSVLNRLHDEENEAADQTNTEVSYDSFIVSLLSFSYCKGCRVT